MDIPEIDARLSSVEEDIRSLTIRLDDEVHHIDAIDKKLDRIHGDLLELIELWRSAKGFVRIVAITGTTVKWVIGIGLAIGAAWAAITGKFHG